MFDRSRFDLDTIAFFVVVALLVAVGAWVLTRDHGGVSSASRSAVSSVSASPSPSSSGSTALVSAGATPSPSPSSPATAGQMQDGEVRITAPVADTWIQVRKNGPKGVVMFSGLVTQGTTRVFIGEVLWLRLRVPGDVRLRIEGRKVQPGPPVGPVDYIIRNGELERQG